MNPNEIATKQDINALHEKLNQLLNAYANQHGSPKNYHPETYLNSKEVCETYKVSKSHLTDLRIEGKIPFLKPFGVLLYPKSEIEKIIRMGGEK